MDSPHQLAKINALPVEWDLWRMGHMGPMGHDTHLATSIDLLPTVLAATGLAKADTWWDGTK